MSPEQLVAVLVAATALVTAIGVIVAQLVSLRKAVDGRLTELVESTRLAATKLGELRGRDFVDVQARQDPSTVGRASRRPAASGGYQAGRPVGGQSSARYGPDVPSSSSAGEP